MKIALVGKGGSGKTTLAGTLARVLAKRQHRLLAIDGDPGHRVEVDVARLAVLARDLAELAIAFLDRHRLVGVGVGHTRDQVRLAFGVERDRQVLEAHARFPCGATCLARHGRPPRGRR